MEIVDWWSEYKVSVPTGVHGTMAVSHFTIKEEEAMSPANLRLILHERLPIPPGVWTRLDEMDANYNHSIWMSDTPQEMQEHFPVFYRLRAACRGARVLIHGLGLGMVVQQAIRAPAVAHIDVVEQSADVIALVSEHYERMARDAGKMLHIHHASCFDAIWAPRQFWDIIWHDIWPDLSEDNLPEMHRLHRMFGTRCTWQGSWSRKEVEKRRAGWRPKDPLEILFGKKKAAEINAQTLEIMRRAKEEDPNVRFI